MAEADVKAIEALLSQAKISAGDMKAVIAKVPVLKKYKPKRLFPEGTINPDVLRVEYDLTPQQFASFAADMATNRSAVVRQWRVFPRGIINPDIFRVAVDFGRPHR